jgi:hypothetical protein
MPVISATQESEIRRIEIEGQQGKKLVYTYNPSSMGGIGRRRIV